MQNKIKDLLCSLKICDEASIVTLYPRVRDRDDISVFKCQKSGVIFLSRSDHMELSHYTQKTGFGYWGPSEREENLSLTLIDDQRRSEQFKDIIMGKVWLDIGTGLGGILDLLAPLASKVLAVEPQSGPRECLEDLGYQVYPDVKNIREQNIEVATLFHVLEHFTEPNETLRAIKSRMIKDGKIIVEVPHANDFLLSTLDNEAFKAFTFWSEHLILHTRQSLKVLLETGGFTNVTVNGFQRYPLANHLYWLAKGKPGGHEAWRHLRAQLLDRAYGDFLKSIDQTDTLIAIAEA